MDKIHGLGFILTVEDVKLEIPLLKVIQENISQSIKITMTKKKGNSVVRTDITFKKLAARTAMIFVFKRKRTYRS